jgi:hypothetical protein
MIVSLTPKRNATHVVGFFPLANAGGVSFALCAEGGYQLILFVRTTSGARICALM